MAYSTSLFSQLLQVIPRPTFDRLVRETKSARYAKGFSCWTQCVAMLFCQFAQSKSLREISDGLRITHGKLNHLGIETAPSKSTLAYAPARRPSMNASLPSCSNTAMPPVRGKRSTSASRTPSTAWIPVPLLSA